MMDLLKSQLSDPHHALVVTKSGGQCSPLSFWFYVNSWGRAKIEKLEIVSECESSGTIFMYYRTEFFS